MMSWWGTEEEQLSKTKGEKVERAKTPAEPAEPPKRQITSQTVDFLLEQRKNDVRSPGIHVSSLAETCPREIALGLVHPLTGGAPAKFGPKMLFRFDVGSAVHGWVQNHYWGRGMRRLIGNWLCIGCGELVKDAIHPDPHDCKKWWARWEYQEMKVSYTEKGWEFPIVGRADGELVANDGSGELLLAELKTWRTESMVGMKQPVAKHVHQATLYAWLRGRKRGVVVYADPAAKFEGPETAPIPMLEFPFEVEQAIIDGAIKKAREVNEAVAQIRAGTFKDWPGKICQKVSDYRAKDCPHRKTCFDDYMMKKILEDWQEKVAAAAKKTG